MCMYVTDWIVRWNHHLCTSLLPFLKTPCHTLGLSSDKDIGPLNRHDHDPPWILHRCILSDHLCRCGQYPRSLIAVQSLYGHPIFSTLQPFITLFTKWNPRFAKPTKSLYWISCLRNLLKYVSFGVPSPLSTAEKFCHQGEILASFGWLFLVEKRSLKLLGLRTFKRLFDSL